MGPIVIWREIFERFLPPLGCSSFVLNRRAVEQPNPFSTMSNIGRERSSGFLQSNSARAAAASILHDNRAALDNRERLAEAFHARSHGGRRAEIKNHDVILPMVDRLFEGELQLDAAHPVQAALKH